MSYANRNKENLIDTVINRYKYDPETGHVYSLSEYNKRSIDKPIGGKNNNGYLRTVVLVDGKNIEVLIHRLAWRLYYGKWPENSINHKNGIKHDNRICNLEDVTHHQNMNHMVALGLRKNTAMGESIGNSKLKTEDVRQIRMLYSEFKKQICDLYNIDIKTINNILQHKTWRHVYEKHN